MMNLVGRFPVVLAAACLAIPGLALAQSRIVPPNPVEFERVALRQTVDSCAFDELRVSVELEGRTIFVTEPQNQCLLPGPPEVVDIQLGAYPSGVYRVEIRLSESQPAVERLEFEVQGIATIAIFPPPPHPIANYTGLWWDRSAPGWGLSLHQGRIYDLFGALFVFGTSGAPEWYTLQSGQWQTSTRWAGEVLRSSGPPWVSATFNAGLVSHADVGNVVLDFTMLPGNEDRARLSLTIGGTTLTKTIERIRL
ncbi:MAG TPA: hypothetical protein VND91_01260 [Candidatus Saccharimonadia bacterium]|nr:hypothetical protein [Candidatus Saccharimonadia bacterium]